MRILSIHNEYLIKGGEDESRRLEAEIFLQKGHQITYYTENNSKIENLSKLNAGLRTLWSKESYNDIKAILKKEKHDVIHVQNFFPLISPSIYYSAKSCGVPIVQAVRNYRLACPAGTFFRDGRICQDCIGKTVPLSGVKHSCYRDNKAASATVAAMLGLHNFLGTWKHVDKFICVSNFVKDKLIEHGYPSSKLVVKPNFVFPDPKVEKKKEDYFIYVGRLQEEKGILLLLNAMSQIDDKNIKLKIVGDGPLLGEVLNHIEKYQNVEYIGRTNLDETYQLIGKARALIIPSLWHEPFGRVVVEAYAKNTPVIGSNVGGISELINNGSTGFLFDPNSVAELIERMCWIKYNNIDFMNQNARIEYENKYTSDANYDMLLSIYNEVIKRD